jgi:hypothetical protein
LQEALQILEIIGAEGQNRTADTGIFRPIITILTKPMISVINLFSLAFFIVKDVGKC